MTHIMLGLKNTFVGDITDMNVSNGLKDARVFVRVGKVLQSVG